MTNIIHYGTNPYDVRLRQGYNKDEYREATPLHHVKLTSGELMTMSRFAFIVDAQDTSSGTVENDVKFSLQLKPIALHIHDGTQISIWNQFKATEPTTTIHILRRPVKEAVPLILAAPLIEDSRNHLYADPAAPLVGVDSGDNACMTSSRTIDATSAADSSPY
ncbi:hypothetical protein AVEN_258845-1 [Araneus ventricosus]|uniref:Uncharacterized protein n=1 Tax=Araneus ventricosus TaxID=182803 RepID=A0A4Y2VK49_ARAVE|nr:hypothetical protein AVEN_258845-1 [Araneus ventricosus]